MKTLFSKDFWRIDSLRGTWEYKSIAFILRGILALMIVTYLLLTAPSIWPWMQKTYIRMQPPEKFAGIIATATQTGDFNWAHQWLSARPRAELETHAVIIEQNIGEVPPVFLTFLMQTSENAGNTDNTQFWMAMARYRMRFDLLRCGLPQAIAEFDKIQTVIFAFQLQKDHLASLADKPLQMADLLQRVLDYDAKYPARNAPLFTCQMAQKLMAGHAGPPPEPAPQEAWQTIRHTLRLITERAIAEMRGETAGPTP